MCFKFLSVRWSVMKRLSCHIKVCVLAALPSDSFPDILAADTRTHSEV